MATAPPGGGNSQVLREYLVALGFRVDENRRRGFDNVLTGLDKKAGALGKSVLGIAAAAGAMAYAFTRSMERMYYNARYADVTVDKLQALEFAGRNIGLAGGEMTQGLKSFAAALRENPGLQAMLEGKFGIQVQGRKTDAIFKDFIKATTAMPTGIANQFGNMFGINPEMLFNLQKGMAELEAAEEKRQQMAKDMGVDADELAESSKEALNIWRELTEQAGIFGAAMVQDALPHIRNFRALTAATLADWRLVSREVSKDWEHVDTKDPQFWDKIWEGLGGAPSRGEGVKLTEQQRLRIGAPVEDVATIPGTSIPMNPVEAWRRWRERRSAKRYPAQEAAVDAVQDMGDFKSRAGVDDEGAGDTSPGGTDEPGFDPQAYLRAIERRYGLPDGILDRVWSAESGRGKNMRSPKGAKGHFQFTNKTARQYGLKDPDDFRESADAAGRKWRDLLQQYGGDARTAAAAWNWGDGNLAKYGLGNAPAETAGFMDKVAPLSVNTEIHMHGVTDPERAGEAAVRRIPGVAQEVQRNMSPKVR